MTENEIETTAEDAVPDVHETKAAGSLASNEKKRDIMLIFLVQYLEVGGGDTTFNLTVFTSSGIVSGKAVPREAWGKAMVDLLMPSGEAFAGAIGDAIEEFKPAEDSIGEFIHMVDARILGHDGMIPRQEGLVWRGSLADINGWSFGSFNS